MSLYYEASTVLTASDKRGSLKSRIYSKDANLKSKPAHIYAVISEAAKYDTLLKEVIDNAGLLTQEPKLTPVLALLLVHDHFFAKGGIAAGASHPLRQSIERHKARLQSELTKARLKRRIPTVEQLKAAILKEKGIITKTTPRWVRVNTVRSSIQSLLQKELAGYEEVGSIQEVVEGAKNAKIYYQDKHIPNLLAFPPAVELIKSPAYLRGDIILQDKASCFPAHLLLGTDVENKAVGDAIDGCAAPGNKTTHMAAIMQKSSTRIYACERDSVRSKTLQMMVNKAGAGNIVTVLARQDFLAVDPQDPRFQNVTHLLLDPSCSGSGILGREDIPELQLPTDQRKIVADKQTSTNAKKRKRTDNQEPSSKSPKVDETLQIDDLDTEATELEELPIEATRTRLEKLSNLQSLIVEHALSFPAARCITYSTCSIHVEENEGVVARVLNSAIAKNRGWGVLKREAQVDGMRSWNHRGIEGDHDLTEVEREACIRCTPGDGEGTMGFFVCGFVRNTSEDELEHSEDITPPLDDWDGFSDA